MFLFRLRFDEAATATFDVCFNVKNLEHQNLSFNAWDDGGTVFESATDGMKVSRLDEACVRATEAVCDV